MFDPAVTTVYFDFDNVLARRAQNRAALVADILGLRDPAALRQYYTEGFRTDAALSQQYRALRTISDEVDFYASLFAHFSPVTHEQAQKAARAFVAVPFITDPAAADVLSLLAQRYKLGILTNGLPSRHHEIVQSGLTEHLAVILVSCDYGSEKPQKAFYEAAAQRANAPLGSLALVDDEPANVAGAKQAGFGQAVQFTPAFWQTVTQAWS